MKTQATLPFELPVKAGARFHEPLAHYDGTPLASVIKDAAGALFFGYAVDFADWDWPLCVVPITQEDADRLESPLARVDFPTGSMREFRTLLGRCDGYYLWEMHGPRGQPRVERVEYFAGPVPEDFKPDPV